MSTPDYEIRLGRRPADAGRREAHDEPSEAQWPVCAKEIQCRSEFEPEQSNKSRRKRYLKRSRDLTAAL